MSDFEVSVPVLVIGGGACSIVAALAAPRRRVSLIEQQPSPAGTTAMSQA